MAVTAEKVTGYAVAGVIIGGGLWLGWREWSKHQEAQRIREDAEMESVAAKQYLDAITAGGRVPTSEELATYNEMLRRIMEKEERIEELSRSELEKFADWCVGIAENWWKIGGIAAALIGTPIAGYVAIRLFNSAFRTCRVGWHRFTCQKPGCGYEATDEADLARHMTEAHPGVATEASKLIEAQGYFNALPAWVQVNIAADAGIYNRAYQRWDTLVPAEIWALAWGAAAAATAGLTFGILYELIWMIPVLVLI